VEKLCGARSQVFVLFMTFLIVNVASTYLSHCCLVVCMFTVMTCLCSVVAGQVQLVRQEGQDVNMSCPSNSPVEWRCTGKLLKIFGDGVRVIAKQNYLFIKNLSVSDTCLYRCYSRSEATLIADYNLTVKVKGNF